MIQADESYDYLVVGGGTAGCVIASRLHEREPTLSILVIEAGQRLNDHPHMYQPLESALLHGSDIDWNYLTTDQKNLDGKPKYNCAVRGLSGGVAINSGM